MQHLALFLPDNRSKLIPWNIPTVTRAGRKQKAFLHIMCSGICPVLLHLRPMDICQFLCLKCMNHHFCADF